MNGFKLLRERWSDPLLTALTALLIFIIFVVAPLEAAGFAQAQDLGFAIAAIVIGYLDASLTTASWEPFYSIWQ